MPLPSYMQSSKTNPSNGKLYADKTIRIYYKIWYIYRQLVHSLAKFSFETNKAWKLNQHLQWRCYAVKEEKFVDIICFGPIRSISNLHMSNLFDHQLDQIGYWNELINYFPIQVIQLKQQWCSSKGKKNVLSKKKKSKGKKNELHIMSTKG